MPYQDNQERFPDFSQQPFPNRDILYGTIQAAWGSSVYQGAAEQGSVTECLEISAPHKLEALNWTIIAGSVVFVTLIGTVLWAAHT